MSVQRKLKSRRAKRNCTRRTLHPGGPNVTSNSSGCPCSSGRLRTQHGSMLGPHGTERRQRSQLHRNAGFQHLGGDQQRVKRIRYLGDVRVALFPIDVLRRGGFFGRTGVDVPQRGFGAEETLVEMMLFRTPNRAL